MAEEFKLKLGFGSVISLSGLLGFCAGAISGPVLLLLTLTDTETEFEFVLIPFFLIGSPIVGLINGYLVGFLAYPLYYWLVNKVGFRYNGDIYVSKEENI